jgi:hypothetical protein
MAEADAKTLIQQLRQVLEEAFEGPRDPNWSYFVANEAESGVLGATRALSARQASRVVGTASIAAHVYHTIFGMEVAAEWIAGKRTPHDWSESWAVG